MKHLLLLAVLVSALVAAEKAAVPKKPFGSYAIELAIAARKEGKGSISDAQFRSMAISLFEYLDGPVRPNGKLFVSVGPPVEDKIIVFVGYDGGLVIRGYDFSFRRKSGILESVTVVPSE